MALQVKTPTWSMLSINNEISYFHLTYHHEEKFLTIMYLSSFNLPAVMESAGAMAPATVRPPVNL